MKFKLLINIGIFLLMTTMSFSGEWIEVDEVFLDSDNDGIPLAVEFRSISCYDKNNCIALPLFPWDRHTTDGGLTWETTLKDTTKTIILPDSTKVFYDPPDVNDVEYVSKNLCIAVCDTGYYWISRDGLKTWEKKQLNTNTYKFYNVDFYNENIGGMLSSRVLYLTKDGANSWKSVQVDSLDLPDDKMPLAFGDNLAFPTQNSIICHGLKKEDDEYYEYVYRSDDFGKTWKAYGKMPMRIKSILYLDSLTGWACGGDQTYHASPYEYSSIVHTTDGGKTWEIQLDTLIHPKTSLRSIDFIDKNNGAALGFFGEMWRTTNGGKDWLWDTTARSQKIRSLTDIEMLGKNEFIACADNRRIYKYSEETGIAFRNQVSNRIKIFPNPVASGEEINIEITGELFSHIELEIYNSKGIKIDKSYNAFLNNGTKKIKYIPDKNLSQGVYFLHVKIGKENFVEKFVVIE